MFDFERGTIKLIRGGKYPHCHTLFIDDTLNSLERLAHIDADAYLSSHGRGFSQDGTSLPPNGP